MTPGLASQIISIEVAFEDQPFRTEFIVEFSPGNRRQYVEGCLCWVKGLQRFQVVKDIAFSLTRKTDDV